MSYIYRPYRLDRSETDTRHNLPSVQSIYTNAGYRLLTKEEVDSLFVSEKYKLDAITLDNMFGIDYVCQDKNGRYIFVQERLKPKRYSFFQEFNLRYERLTSKVRTEESKIKQFIHNVESGVFRFRNGYKQNSFTVFIVYAFINDDTGQIIKRVTANLNVLYHYLDEGRIVPVPKGHKNWDPVSGFWDDEHKVFYAPIMPDRDGSASFVNFNVVQMQTHFTDFNWIFSTGDWKLRP